MILVVTPETLVPNETEIISQMLQEGLDLLHLRKPLIGREAMKRFLDHIDKIFHPQLALHGYYDLGSDYNISRFHFRETDRINEMYKPYAGQNILSTSVHDIESYNALGKEWEYAFVSPVFPSISKKGYGENSNVMESIKHRNNQDVQLIALGGINEDNICEAIENGADGAALLGAIWESDQPLHTFRKCRNNILSLGG